MFVFQFPILKINYIYVSHIFCSQVDDHLPNREEAERLWDEIGNQYLHENEEQLKEKIDFLPDNLDHYPPNGNYY